MNVKSLSTTGLSAAVVALAVIGFNRCGGAASAPQSAAASAPASTPAPAPVTGGAEIKGVIKFEGKVPAASPVKMTADANCAATADKAQMGDSWLVTDGKLANAFVYLKEGVDMSKVPAADSAPAVIFDQKGCWYMPHVFGIRVGQTLEIRNSDKTNHNVHSMATNENDQFNQGMAAGVAPITKTFTAEEIGAHIKCDVHSWMSAYAGVVSHPYFAVSGADGSYSIKNVPPGKYTVHVWHEGDVPEVTGEVTVTEAGATQDFTFKK